MALIHAPVRSTKLTGWLSRDGDSIVFRLLGSAEPLRFRESGTEPSEESPWNRFDRILRSTGK